MKIPRIGPQTFNLRVRTSELHVKSAGNDAIAFNQHCTDEGIRTDMPLSLPRQTQTLSHVPSMRIVRRAHAISVSKWLNKGPRNHGLDHARITSLPVRTDL